MNAQKVLVGTLAGLVAGVAIGVLTAPASGAETRQKISDSAENLKKRFRRLRGKSSEDLDDLKEVFESEIDGLRDDVRQRVLALIETSKSKYNHVKQEVMS